MLYLFTSFAELDVEQLLAVYTGSVDADSISQYRSFCVDLENFFNEGGTLAVWLQEGCYVSALRFESYMDGYLISCLETRPDLRRTGCATMLLKGVFDVAHGPIYAHVQKNNAASLHLHKGFGFKIMKDYAVYVDGSVYRTCYTMRRDP